MDKIKWILDNYNYITGNDVDNSGWGDGSCFGSSSNKGIGCGSGCWDSDGFSNNTGDGAGKGYPCMDKDGHGYDYRFGLGKKYGNGKRCEGSGKGIING